MSIVPRLVPIFQDISVPVRSGGVPFQGVSLKHQNTC